MTALPHFFEHDASWLAQFFSLLVLPFAHEDLAILLGGYIVVNDMMPVALVALCIYGGMVASDFALYGIGAGARRLPWLTRVAVNDRVRAFAERLKRNLFGLVALSRVVPGVVFVVFVACGWTRVPLARFAMASLVVSALYLPLMLCIVVFFGDALDDRAGFWTWPLLLCVLVAIGFVRRQVFSFRETGDAAAVEAAAAGDRRADTTDPAGGTTLAEWLPRGLFRLLLALSWVAFALRYRSLTLPTVVNPRSRTRGQWGESKSDYLLAAAAGGCGWIADFVVVTRSTQPRTLYGDLERARRSLGAAGLAFPLFARPDTGHSGARTIADMSELREYLHRFPGGEKLILQRSVAGTGEAKALYARPPGAQSGRILSLAVRSVPDATGRMAYRDARHYLTPELEQRIVSIARGMHEFHFGRFELRFASTAELMRGEGLSVVEISGVGGEASEARDPTLPLIEVCRRLVEQQRIMFLIGDRNRARGFAPLGCADVLKSLIKQNESVRRFSPSA